MTTNVLSKLFRKSRCAYGKIDYESLSTEELIAHKSKVQQNLWIFYGINIVLLIVASIAAYHNPAMISLIGVSATNIAVLDQEHKKLKRIRKELERRSS